MRTSTVVLWAIRLCYGEMEPYATPVHETVANKSKKSLSALPRVFFWTDIESVSMCHMMNATKLLYRTTVLDHYVCKTFC